jgi:hypothetical protein
LKSKNWKVGNNMADENETSKKNRLEQMLGISYQEFEKLDYDEQQKLLKQYRKTHPRKKSSETTVMIGSGEHATFIKVKKGEKIMLDDGTFVEAGLTLEEEKQRLEDRMDDIIYSKPVAFVKKLTRRIKKDL